MTVSSLLRVGRITAGVLGFSVGSAGVLGAVVSLEAARARGTARRSYGVIIPRSEGTFGADEATSGEPLHLSMLGDSLAVGVGAETTEQTVGGRLAEALAVRLGRPVTLHSVAAVGAASQDLNGQVASLARHHVRTDVAVIVIGGNDTLGLANMTSAVRRLYRAVVDLRGQGAHVIVATCPDLGTLRPLFQPLRFLARRFSRRLAVAQTIVVVRAGGRAVPLGDTLGPIFWRRPKTMFSADHFHPSPLGYARAAAVLFPSVLAAAERGRIPQAGSATPNSQNTTQPDSQTLTEARP